MKVPDDQHGDPALFLRQLTLVLLIEKYGQDEEQLNRLTTSELIELDVRLDSSVPGSGVEEQ